MTRSPSTYTPDAAVVAATGQALMPQGRLRLLYFTGEPVAAEEAMRLH